MEFPQLVMSSVILGSFSAGLQFACNSGIVDGAKRDETWEPETLVTAVDGFLLVLYFSMLLGS